MDRWLIIVISFFVALGSVTWIFPKLLYIALKKKITDNPNVRKLQKRPIPILGGAAIFFGLVLSLSTMSLFWDCTPLYIVLSAMILMLYTGTMDDIIGLSPRLRFVIEIIAVLLLYFVGGFRIDNLHGLWGVYYLPGYVSLPLTLFAAVGIINAINLIDGVDGLSSGYGIMSCWYFFLLFLTKGDLPLAALALAGGGSLIPFFFHNVFGLRSKMFIGDGGTLVLGVLLSTFVMGVLQDSEMATLAAVHGAGLAAMTLSVLAIPVFDTVRVMTSRMLRGQSPFHPDKTHLHHMFIELGCSHLMTSIFILTLNAIIIAAWWVLFMLDFSIETQTYAIVALGVLFTTGLYEGIYAIRRHAPAAYSKLAALGKKMRIERGAFFRFMQQQADRF